MAATHLMRVIELLSPLVFMIAINGFIDPAQARAVNISNTWTLPQEGFSVFYRYFRDKISWFEADAVCQFHHANLVTVNNGVQFDSTRAFLKELDVTGAVWIGLMRPENSARFTWISSRTLDASNNGYWAEAIPAIEQPLCAVLDPVRDFRWHALRCGGPETAAFLCELPVPAWAVDCTLTSIPSLTVQYMSDSGTVQLARDCGESGTKHISCQGKQDRDSMVEQLQCSETENLVSVLATDNSNRLQLPPVLSSKEAPGGGDVKEPITITAAGGDRAMQHQQPQQPILEHDILTVVSGNDDEESSSTGEGNNIEINPNQIEDTVKNVIKQFNLQGMMQNEQMAVPGDESPSLPSMEQDPAVAGKKQGYMKKHSKKNRYETKVTGQRGKHDDVKEAFGMELEAEDDDERMLGDQPLTDETETQPIDIIQEAVKLTPDGDYPMVEPAVMVTTRVAAVTSVPTEGDPSAPTTADSRIRRATAAGRETTAPDEFSAASDDLAVATQSSSWTTWPTDTSVTHTTAINHVLPTTSRKELYTSDHFIPPMLLVKARLIFARPLADPAITSTPVTVASSEMPETDCITSLPNTSDDITSISSSSATVQKDDSGAESKGAVVTLDVPTPATIAVKNDPHDAGAVTLTLPSTVPSVHGVTDTHQSLVAVTLDDTSVSSTTGVPNVGTGNVTAEVAPTSTRDSNLSEIVSVTGDTVELSVSSTTPSRSSLVEDLRSFGTTISPIQTANNSWLPSSAPSTELHHDDHVDGPVKIEGHHPVDGELLAGEEHEQGADGGEPLGTGQPSELNNMFSNVDNYQPYKPNRHRSLTKQEQHINHANYIKKILG
ncbi:uncharacterized protein LOC131213512 [Anopheles bellator]|uniref:uncharacterized protein LOC131213512 n=1 Tax=Anopheles bellator TaxID=139047 RepID=UPI002647F5DB|nr:uncharacterized protein LOC131213512 [Anopheles bellator]